MTPSFPPRHSQRHCIFGSQANLDFVEKRRLSTVTDLHALARLTLTTVGNAPDHSFFLRANRLAGVPEFLGDTRIAGIAQNAMTLAAPNLPGDFRTELE